MPSIEPNSNPHPNPVTPRARELFPALLTIQEQKGISEYGESLRTHNGRDAALDALYELVDAFQYVVQLRMEVADLKAENAELRFLLSEQPRPYQAPAVSPPTFDPGPPVPRANPGPHFGPEPHPDWLPLPHVFGDRPCGGPAMYVVRPIIRQEPADLAHLRVGRDLHIPGPNDQPRCLSCNELVHPYTNQDLDWSGVLVDHLPGAAPGPGPTPIPSLPQAAPPSGHAPVPTFDDLPSSDPPADSYPDGGGGPGRVPGAEIISRLDALSRLAREARESQNGEAPPE